MFLQPTDFGSSGLTIMPEYHFKELISVFSVAFDDKASDPWAKIQLFIEGYNKNQNANIAASI